MVDYNILQRGDFCESFFVLSLLYIPCHDSFLFENQELQEQRA